VLKVVIHTHRIFFALHYFAACDCISSLLFAVKYDILGEEKFWRRGN
jgi:hypothetical protein